MVSSTVVNIPSVVPHGKYTVVGIDIDTTGRRLIDEIVQLAAYTPNDHFEHYIMPYMNLNPAARQRHQVRVISIGFYRMLKSMQTYKIIKSKAEIVVIKDFLDWLEQIKAKDTNSLGIIMVYHEERKFIPYMILESLKKYNLLDRFANTVKSFANGLILAKSTVNETMQQLSLRKLHRALSPGGGNVSANSSGCSCEVSSTTGPHHCVGDSGANGGPLSKTSNSSIPSQSSASGGDSRQIKSAKQQDQQQQQQNDRELFDGNASVRAKLAYEVALQLANREQKDVLNSSFAFEKMLQKLLRFAQPIELDLKELETQNQNLERQNSFRPIFLNYFKTTLYHRVRAVKFRIVLAEQGYDLQTLNAIWDEKQKEGLIEVLNVIEELKPDDKSELADLFDSYFDPNKTTIKPVVKNNNRRRNRRGMRANRNDGSLNARTGIAEQGAGGDKQQHQVSSIRQTPDSTTGGHGSGSAGNQGNHHTGASNLNGRQQNNKSTPPSNSGNNGGKPPRNRRNQRSRNNSVKNQSSAVNLQVSPAAVATVSVPMVATN